MDIWCNSLFDNWVWRKGVQILFFEWHAILNFGVDSFGSCNFSQLTKTFDVQIENQTKIPFWSFFGTEALQQDAYILSSSWFNVK